MPERDFMVKTNADRVRSMTDEQLAEVFAQTQILVASAVLALHGIVFECSHHDRECIKQEMLKRLQQPVEVEP